MEKEQQVINDKEDRYIYQIIRFLKNPLNLFFIMILVIGILIRLKYFFIESIWTDEAHYMLYGSRLTLNPLYILDKIFSGGVYIPQALIGVFNIFTTPFIAGRLMALTYSILGIIFSYLLGKEVKDRYVGLGLALLFTFNHEIFFNSSRTLTDVPVTTMFVIVMYFLVKYEKSAKIKDLIYLIIVSIAAFLTKAQAYLLLPIIIVYYIGKFILIKEERNKIKIRKLLSNKFFYVTIILFAFLVIWRRYYIYNTIIASRSIYFDFVKLLPYIVGWTVILFFLIGVLITLVYRKKEYLIALSWIIVVYGVFMVQEQGVYPRYILPVIPGIFLLALIGLFELFTYLKISSTISVHKIMILFLILLVAYPYYLQGTAIAEQKKYTYTGYEEAGTWLKENADNGYSQVFVGSTSPSTLYSGIKHHSDGGSMRGTSEYKDINGLIEYINNNSTAMNFYVQLSVWEYGDYWAFPITQELVNKFTSNSFQIVKVVEREILTNNGLQKTPVFIIFKYTKQDNINNINNAATEL